MNYELNIKDYKTYLSAAGRVGMVTPACRDAAGGTPACRHVFWRK
jgi:hypothetical protein